MWRGYLERGTHRKRESGRKVSLVDIFAWKVDAEVLTVLREIEEEDSLWHSRRRPNKKGPVTTPPPDESNITKATVETAKVISEVPQGDKDALKKRGTGNFY
jgi:hypothetical protein